MLDLLKPSEKLRKKLLEEELRLRSKQPEHWAKTKYRKFAALMKPDIGLVREPAEKTAKKQKAKKRAKNTAPRKAKKRGAGKTAAKKRRAKPGARKPAAKKRRKK